MLECMAFYDGVLVLLYKKEACMILIIGGLIIGGPNKYRF